MKHRTYAILIAIALMPLGAPVRAAHVASDVELAKIIGGDDSCVACDPDGGEMCSNQGGDLLFHCKTKYRSEGGTLVGDGCEINKGKQCEIITSKASNNATCGTVAGTCVLGSGPCESVLIDTTAQAKCTEILIPLYGLMCQCPGAITPATNGTKTICATGSTIQD